MLQYIIFNKIFHSACQSGQFRNDSDSACYSCPANFFSTMGSANCTPCDPDYFKPDPARMLNNSDFESDSVGISYLLYQAPAQWAAAGTVGVVGSLNSFLGSFVAQSGSHFAVIMGAGSYIEQLVYPQNSVSYHLTFYAANRPNSPGGTAPLAIYANAQLLGSVSPTAVWQLYQFQFRVPAGLPSFYLRFIVGSFNKGDVSIFIDNVIMLSDQCAPCTTYFCPGGTWLADLPCGGISSCIACPAGSFCAGGIAAPSLCPPFTYSFVGSTACSPCPQNCSSGYYLSGSCSLSGNIVPPVCLVCPSGFYCPDGLNLYTCPVGSYSFTGSLDLSQCVSPPFGGLTPSFTYTCSPFSITSLVSSASALFVADAGAYLFEFEANNMDGSLSGLVTSTQNSQAGTNGFSMIVNRALSCVYSAGSLAITACVLTPSAFSLSNCISASFPPYQVDVMVWSPDSLYLYAGLSSGDLVMYLNTSNNALTYSSTLYFLAAESFSALLISADWAYLYGGTWSSLRTGHIYQWIRLMSGGIRFLEQPVPVGMPVYSMAFDPSNLLLYVLGETALMLFQRANYGVINPIAVFSVAHPTAPYFGAFNTLVMSGDSFQRSLYTCDSSSWLRQYACADNTGELSLTNVFVHGCSALAMHPSGATVYAASGNQLLAYSRQTSCQPGMAPDVNNTCVACGTNFYANVDEAATVCLPCDPSYFKPPPGRMLNNSDFDSTNIFNISGISQYLPDWDVNGDVVVSSSYSIYNISAQSHPNFVALKTARSQISQRVYPLGSTMYDLTFYAANFALSPGGAAPLAVYANSNLLGFVTPPPGSWHQFEFQFSVPIGLNSFVLQFIVGDINPGDVTILIDTVIILSNKCALCTTFSCPGGSYLLDLPCGGASSCRDCDGGNACPGGVAPYYQCPVETYSLASSSTCTSCIDTCPIGYYLFGACVSAGNSIPSSCNLCPSSSYCLGGADSPVSCPVGTYSYSGSGSSSACIFPPFGLIVEMTSTNAVAAASNQVVWRVVANATGIISADSLGDFFLFIRSSITGLVSGTSNFVSTSNSNIVSVAVASDSSGIIYFVTPASPYFFYCVPPLVTGCCMQLSPSDLTSPLSSSGFINHLLLSYDALFLYTADALGALISYTFDYSSFVAGSSPPIVTSQQLASTSFGEAATFLLMSTDLSFLYMGSASGLIYQFSRDVSFGSLVAIYPPFVVADDYVVAMVFDPTGSYVYCLSASTLATFTRDVVLGGLSSGPVFSFPHPTSTLFPSLVVSFETFQRSLYTCDNTGALRVYACSDQSPDLALFKILPNLRCTALAISPDGANLYVGTSNSTGLLRSFARNMSCTTGEIYNRTHCAVCPTNTYSTQGDASCSPCPSSQLKPVPSLAIVNSGFELDVLSGAQFIIVTPSFWFSSFGTLYVVASSSAAFGGMVASQGAQFAAIQGPAATLGQTFPTDNATSFALTFMASNSGVSSTLAPLSVVANGALLGTVNPPLAFWQTYKFQFVVPLNTETFDLIFAIPNINLPSDVTIFIDSVIMLTNACQPHTGIPTRAPTNLPTKNPTREPSLRPSRSPSLVPTLRPSKFPSLSPTKQPSTFPSAKPSRAPTLSPTTLFPTMKPSSKSPTIAGFTYKPTVPTFSPTHPTTTSPTIQPTSFTPSAVPSSEPTSEPTCPTTEAPTYEPTFPTNSPTKEPTYPTQLPSALPSTQPTSVPSTEPTDAPSGSPSSMPTNVPSSEPTDAPSVQPSAEPTAQPSAQPTDEPSLNPTVSGYTYQPTDEPSTLFPSSETPTLLPTFEPSTKTPVTENPSMKPTTFAPTTIRPTTKTPTTKIPSTKLPVTLAPSFSLTVTPSSSPVTGIPTTSTPTAIPSNLPVTVIPTSAGQT